MKVTTTQQVTIDLTQAEAAVLRRVLGGTFEEEGAPEEVITVVNDLFGKLGEVPGVSDAADRYLFNGGLDFKGLSD